MAEKNVILIGMPGAGKSTVGVVLAKRLGYSFTDSDLVIQEKTGKLLYQLIETHGEEGFLEIENKINAALSLSGHVIATGGSVVYGEEAMEHLSEIGCVVYLKLSYQELTERLGDLHKRGHNSNEKRFTEKQSASVSGSIYLGCCLCRTECRNGLYGTLQL